MSILFAKRLFLFAGCYGVLAVAPLFFLEKTLNEQYPPAITHPEFYYGFAFVTLAWQFVYLLMSRDPVRYRLLLLPAIFGKAGFALTTFVLARQNRFDASGLLLPSVDLVLACFFLWAFIGLKKHDR